MSERECIHASVLLNVREILCASEREKLCPREKERDYVYNSKRLSVFV